MGGWSGGRGDLRSDAAWHGRETVPQRWVHLNSVAFQGVASAAEDLDVRRRVGPAFGMGDDVVELQIIRRTAPDAPPTVALPDLSSDGFRNVAGQVRRIIRAQ